VKFIRFAQWRIEQTGYGILAFITNHGYLDNPTFRGMRNSLVSTFDDIYVLDLHGNSKKREKAPDGEVDENVFDIQQGVAIGLFVKKRQGNGKRIFHADIYGSRRHKYVQLSQTDILSTPWEQVPVQKPGYLFRSLGNGVREEYMNGLSVVEAFDSYTSGVTTARNHFAMDCEKEVLSERMTEFRDPRIEDSQLASKYGLRTVSYWSLNSARREMMADTQAMRCVLPYCYRPFDNRFVMYHPAVCERMRQDVMRHMMQENVALLTHRPQSPGDFTFVFAARLIGDQCVAANKSAGGGNSYQFPLFRYPAALGNLFVGNSIELHNERVPNVSGLWPFSGGIARHLLHDGEQVGWN
jgi:predicted helicase